MEVKGGVEDVWKEVMIALGVDASRVCVEPL
jgi:hypothetical protein